MKVSHSVCSPHKDSDINLAQKGISVGVAAQHLDLRTDAIRNPERHVRKASHRGSKQQ